MDEYQGFNINNWGCGLICRDGDGCQFIETVDYGNGGGVEWHLIGRGSFLFSIHILIDIEIKKYK